VPDHTRNDPPPPPATIMTGPADLARYRIESDQTSWWPYHWTVRLYERLERPRGVVEHRVLARFKGRAWSADRQGPAVDAAMDRCRSLIATTGPPSE
jgi:hypothetical protein